MVEAEFTNIWLFAYASNLDVILKKDYESVEIK